MSDYRFTFPPYAIGWFQVAYSDDLKVGDVRPLRYFGRDMVLFRGEDGTPSVLDAHCPHLGAHMGHGGRVEGNSLRCPFHAWKFDTDGECVDIPYGEKTPKGVCVNKWPLVEINGLIMVWFHPDGEAPTWELPVVPEYGDDAWTSYETRRWKIKTRNQEMAENAVDQAHFLYLHGTHNMPNASINPEGHILNSLLPTTMKTAGGLVEGEVQVKAYGFGFTLNRFVGLVETLIVNSVTPIDEEYLDVRFAFMVKKMGGRSITDGIGMAFVREISRQLEQDIPIWENKMHVRPPILSDGDGPIAKYRRWCKQFYADPNAQP